MRLRGRQSVWLIGAGFAAAMSWALWPGAPNGTTVPAAMTSRAREDDHRALLAAAPRRPEAMPEAAPGAREVSAESSPPAASAIGGGGILEGEVRDAEGRPAKGVVVTALAPDEPLPPRGRDHTWYVSEAEIARAKARQPSAVSDAAGHYEIRGVPLGAEVTAAVHVTDRLDGRSTSATFSLAGERQRRDVALPEPGRLVVRVAGWRPGASRIGQITVLGPTGWSNSFDESVLAEGEWRIDGLRPGPYTVQIFPRGAPVETRSTEVPSNQRAVVEIALPSGRILDGLVVTETGEPIAGADVWWLGAQTIMGTTDGAGRFHFEGIAAEVGTLRVTDASGPMRGDHVARASRYVEGVAAGGPPMRIVLSPAPRVRARIVGLDPATRIGSLIVSRSIHAGDSARRLGDGRIETTLTNPLDPAMWVLTTPGFAPLVVEVGGPYPEATRDLGELRFDGGRTVAGEVRDVSGRAVAGATVRLTDKWADDEEQARQQTGADGAFRFELMPVRPIEVRVDAEGYPVHIVMLPVGRAGEQPKITLTRGGTLRIRVLDAEGAVVPGATVTFMPDGPRPYDVDYDRTRRSRTADADGFLEARLQARGHRIRADAPNDKRKGHVESVLVEEGGAASLEIRVR